MDKKEIQELLLQKRKEGKLVLDTLEGFMEVDLNEFIKQPAEGMLYDLNRDVVTILTFIDKPTWINNFACMVVIEKLKEYYDKEIK